MTRNALFRAIIVFACGAVCAHAEVRLHHLFTDHAVLQQGTTVPIWGWADDGEKVTVEFRGQRESVVAKKGQWMVKLGKMRAGNGETLRVEGSKTAQPLMVHDVAVGEVWLASGQSNMEMALRNCQDPTNDIASSANPAIHLFTVPKLKATVPTNDVNGSWQLCSPETVGTFSGVAYYFARDLQKALGVPVGVIHTSWGGSPAEVWIREDIMASDKEYRRDILDKSAAQVKTYETAVAQWEKERAAAVAEGKQFTKRRPGIGWRPAELYNGMITNLIPYAFKGAIWYQGESNAGRAWEYRRLFADMIENWRHDFDRDFTFLEVQLAPFDKSRKRTIEQITAEPVESDWAELREAQLIATKKLSKVGMAVITDVGDKDDIHPKKKGPVGSRLALLARKIAYGENIVADGPEFKSVRFKDGKAVLSFKNIGDGLEARDGALRGFAIAGEDKKFVWATANIEGDKVVVSNPAVAKPAAVRFGWADFPVVNLYNKQGLPATPFRTDDWTMLTAPKLEAKK